MLYHVIEWKVKADNWQLDWFSFCSLDILQNGSARGKYHFINQSHNTLFPVTKQYESIQRSR